VKPFVAWPGWRHLAYASLLTLFVNGLFVVVYFGSDSVVAHERHHLHLFVQQELAIPLWPSTIIVYDSLYLLFLLAPFVLRTKESFRRLVFAAAATILAAGACFLLLPAELGFAPAVVAGPFATIFRVSDAINLDYNLVPSLHVALAVLCLQAFWPAGSWPVRLGLALWGAGLATSTLLTHQHHVLDVAAGAALAVVVFHVPRRVNHAE
jgi:membrane-associated phospholipid phosphatase